MYISNGDTCWVHNETWDIEIEVSHPQGGASSLCDSH